MKISDENIQETGEYLGGVKEPGRTEYGNIRHKLIDIIVIAFTATLCGSDEFEEMSATFANTVGALPRNLAG
jgi:hypothetical protein